MAAAVALLLAAVMVVPLLADAYREASVAASHVALSMTDHDHDHGDDGAGPDELVHHAQTHAQGVMPAPAKASATMSGAEVALVAMDDPDRAEAAVRGPFEPPRA